MDAAINELIGIGLFADLHMDCTRSFNIYMSMTLYDVNRLDLAELAQVTWEQETHLHVQAARPYYINLYSITDFHAAVWYQVEDNTIEKVESFRSTKVLEKFVEGWIFNNYYEFPKEQKLVHLEDHYSDPSLHSGLSTIQNTGG